VFSHFINANDIPGSDGTRDFSSYGIPVLSLLALIFQIETILEGESGLKALKVIDVEWLLTNRARRSFAVNTFSTHKMSTRNNKQSLQLKTTAVTTR
jgi:hypothetical protein